MKYMEEKKAGKQLAAFQKKNYLVMAVGYVLVLVGFLLMMGPGSTDIHFEPDIFSVRRIGVAPVICFTGFMVVLVGIVYQPKASQEEE